MFCEAVPTSRNSESEVALFLFYSNPTHHDYETLPLGLKAIRIINRMRSFVPGTLIIAPHKVHTGYLYHKSGYQFASADGENFVLNFDTYNEINQVLLEYANRMEIHPTIGPFMRNDKDPSVVFEVLDTDLFPEDNIPGLMLLEFWISNLALFYAQVTKALVLWVREPQPRPLQKGGIQDIVESSNNVYWMWFPDCKPRNLSGWLQYLADNSFTLDQKRLLVQISPMSAGFYLAKVRRKSDKYQINLLDSVKTEFVAFEEPDGFDHILQEVDPVHEPLVTRSKLVYRYDFALSSKNTDEDFRMDFGLGRTPVTTAYFFSFGNNFPFSGARADPSKISEWMETSDTPSGENTALLRSVLLSLRRDANITTKKASAFLPFLRDS